MPARHFPPGMDAFRRPKGAALPAIFYGMNHDEIVEFLMNDGYSPKAAENDATAFDAHRGYTESPTPAIRKEVERNDSVSETEPPNRFAFALRRAFDRRRGE